MITEQKRQLHYQMLFEDIPLNPSVAAAEDEGKGGKVLFARPVGIEHVLRAEKGQVVGGFASKSNNLR